MNIERKVAKKKKVDSRTVPTGKKKNVFYIICVALILNPNNELGGFGYAWTIVMGVVVVSVGIPFLYYFLKIFTAYRYLLYVLILAGVVFVLGAIGMENFQVYIKSYGVGVNRFYILMLEEFFEMVGVSLAIFVFIRFYGELQNSTRR